MIVVDDKLVDSVAELAKLRVTSAKKASYQKKLQEIVDFFSELESLEIEMATYSDDSGCPFREDVEVTNDFRKAMNEAAPDMLGSSFRVPRILE